ncbi:unnamed protein product [Meloidogyne enterolobii]|uniref:Uncharacterized protein n=1 Tax=Meloidogyne enterolobii TaxID=390850 RepID=A0ACB0Y4N2_MELEN
MPVKYKITKAKLSFFTPVIFLKMKTNRGKIDGKKEILLYFLRQPKKNKIRKEQKINKKNALCHQKNFFGRRRLCVSPKILFFPFKFLFPFIFFCIFNFLIYCFIFFCVYLAKETSFFNNFLSMLATGY